MNTGLRLSIVLLTTLFISRCKNNDVLPQSKEVSIKLNITYKVDNLPAIFDTLLYHNLAGNNYEVTRLEYYISNITFLSDTGKNFVLPAIFYVDARSPSTNNIKIDSVPAGRYSGITLNIGIDSVNNKTNSLLNTSQNINMAWPSSMGGGYHFMKFEGYYVYPPSLQGFTMHVGQNTSLVYCTINKSFEIGASATEIKLSMNLNEWFHSPSTYDFNVDGNFIMGNVAAMGKIAANGNDVFSME